MKFSRKPLTRRFLFSRVLFAILKGIVDTLL